MAPKDQSEDEQNFPFRIVHLTPGFLILCAYSKRLNALTNKFVLYNGFLFLFFQVLARVVGPQYKNVRHCLYVLENFRPQNVDIDKLPVFQQCLLQLFDLT